MFERRIEPLTLATWISHAALLAAVTLGVLTAGLGAPARAALLVLAASPLLLALPGLYRHRRTTYRWLALVLVPYAGLAAAEVVATLGSSPFAGIALLASLVELALLFALVSRGKGVTRGTGL